MCLCRKHQGTYTHPHAATTTVAIKGFSRRNSTGNNRSSNRCSGRRGEQAKSTTVHVMKVRQRDGADKTQTRATRRCGGNKRDECQDTLPLTRLGTHRNTDTPGGCSSTNERNKKSEKLPPW